MIEEELHPWEKHRLHRWRMKWSTEEAANHFGVSEAEYEVWESPESKNPRYVPALGGLVQNERYVIYRIREGLSQSELARRMGARPSRICLEERGRVPPTTLKEFWGV